jgi:hypothetical protein
MLSWFFVFVALFLFVAMLDIHDDKSWLRAAILTAFYYFVTIAIAANPIFGWGLGFAIGIFVVMQVMRYSMGTATLFLLASWVIEIVIVWGVAKYIH